MSRQRDYRAEYAARKAKGAAQGLTARQSAGHRGEGFSVWDEPAEDAAGSVESYLRRLRGDRIVFLHAEVELNGDPQYVELYPHGGIRAAALLDAIEQAGGVVELIEQHFGAGQVHTSPTRPPADQRNGPGGSPRYRLDPAKPMVVEVISVWLQWK